jgi:hypothetical protein
VPWTRRWLRSADRASADVVLKYHTVRGADVDLKVLEERRRTAATEPAKPGILGRLVVALYPCSSMTTPLSARPASVST